MQEKITVFNDHNEKIECNVLIRFTFFDNEYIVYTDNKTGDKNEFNLYKALIKNNHLYDPTDVDVIPVFDKLIKEYKRKVIQGEI